MVHKEISMSIKEKIVYVTELFSWSLFESPDKNVQSKPLTLFLWICGPSNNNPARTARLNCQTKTQKSGPFVSSSLVQQYLDYCNIWGKYPQYTPIAREEETTNIQCHMVELYLMCQYIRCAELQVSYGQETWDCIKFSLLHYTWTLSFFLLFSSFPWNV